MLTSERRKHDHAANQTPAAKEKAQITLSRANQVQRMFGG